VHDIIYGKLSSLSVNHLCMEWQFAGSSSRWNWRLAQRFTATHKRINRPVQHRTWRKPN